MGTKDAHVMANGVDPDQTAPLGAVQYRPWSDCCLIWVYTVCPDLSVQKLRNFTVKRPKKAYRMANSIDPDQTASLDAVWSGSTYLPRPFWPRTWDHYTMFFKKMPSLTSDPQLFWKWCSTSAICFFLFHPLYLLSVIDSFYVTSCYVVISP